MPIEKSAGAVIFRRKEGEIFYLLLHYPSSAGSSKPHSRASALRGKEYWDFPKGHIEKGEKTEETMKREVLEETGLKDIKIIEGFKEWIKYFFRFENKNIMKFVTFYLAETKIKEVKISDEHLGFQWLPFEKAMGKLTFKNAKEILKKANGHLSKKGL